MRAEEMMVGDLEKDREIELLTKSVRELAEANRADANRMMAMGSELADSQNRVAALESERMVDQATIEEMRERITELEADLEAWTDAALGIDGSFLIESLAAGIRSAFEAPAKDYADRWLAAARQAFAIVTGAGPYGKIGPCPFCNQDTGELAEEGEVHRVDCMNPECLASGPPSANGADGAIAAWNRSVRAAP